MLYVGDFCETVEIHLLRNCEQQDSRLLKEVGNLGQWIYARSAGIFTQRSGINSFVAKLT